MIYNLDKTTKQNILAQYKQDALNYRQRKQNERIKRIQEEREYILDRIRKEREADMRLKEEKIQRQNEQMKEYHDLLKSLRYDKPGYHFKPKNNDVINKNWGRPRYDQNISAGGKEIKNENNKNNIINNKSLDLRKMSPSQKEREYIRKEDNMSSYLTDDNNKKEFEKYLIEQKEKRQKYYRELLDLQYQEIQKKNNNLYGTIDPLIVQREKRKNLADNPYVKKSQYDFGQSTLSHNPITNPENNIYYNKYLFRVNNDRLKRNKNNDINSSGHIFNKDINEFKTIDNQRHNFGINNSKSSINVFRNNQNKNIDKYYINEKNNIINNNNDYKYQALNKYDNVNINNNINYDNKYLNIHSLPTVYENKLSQAAASNIFS